MLALLNSFSMLDLALGGFILFSVILGYFRGMIREILTIVAWVSAVVVTMLLVAPVASYFAKRFAGPSVSYVLSFLSLFLGTLILGKAGSYFVSAVFRGAGFGGIDRLLGLVFGFLRGAMLVLVLVWFGRYTPVTQYPAWQASWLIQQSGKIVTQLQTRYPRLLDLSRYL